MNIDFHHIGYVVDNIKSFPSFFPNISLLKTVYDPLQLANISLYKNNSNNSCYLEFIEPSSSNSFTWEHLKKFGPSIHHLCYGPVDKDSLDLIVLEKKLFLLRGPIYAELFKREVIFYMTRKKALLEFIL